MKKLSPILQMYHGKRGTSDHILSSEEYARLLEIAEGYDNKFRKKIKDNDELLSLFDKVLDANADLSCESVDLHYVEGFRFGFLMAIDVLHE
ncbi:MAG: hypothetical protein E7368_04470 [Clostridiales bacterium]|nr:hypothetical protein [Clostridiales bacterium]